MRLPWPLLSMLAACQLAAGIDTTCSPPVESPKQIVVGPSLLLFDAEPGPTLVRAGKDDVFFAIGPEDDGKIRELWSVPKNGGGAVQFDSSAYAVAAQVVGDDLFVADSHEIVRINGDRSVTSLFRNRLYGEYNRAIAVHDGSVFWLSRKHAGLRSIPVDGTEEDPTFVAGAGEHGSYALHVDSTRAIWGSDYTIENKPDGAILEGGAIIEMKTGEEPHTIREEHAHVTDIAVLDGRYYIATENETKANRIIVWDGSNITFIAYNQTGIRWPTRLIARAPYLYVEDAGDFGFTVGGIWRYEPKTETWTLLISALYPRFDIDDTHLFYSELVVARRDGFKPEPTRRRLWKVPL